MTFYILAKGYTVPGNLGTHDKLNKIPFFIRICDWKTGKKIKECIKSHRRMQKNAN